MPSKAFSFRLPDAAVQALEALQLNGETLNQTAQRVLMEHLGLSTNPSTLSTGVDIELMIKQQVETSLNEVRSQLDELRGKFLAR